MNTRKKFVPDGIERKFRTMSYPNNQPIRPNTARSWMNLRQQSKKKFWNLKTGRISIIWNRKNINYSKTEFDCDFLFHPSRSIDTVTLNHHFLVGKTWILWKKQPKAVFTKKIKKFWEKGIFKLNERLHQVVEQNIESIFEFF